MHLVAVILTIFHVSVAFLVRPVVLPQRSALKLSTSASWQTSSSIPLHKPLDIARFLPPEYLISLLGKRRDKLRWTAQDVSVSSGVDLESAERDLLTLAMMTNGRLEVTQAGSILYSFPTNMELVLLQQSFWRRIKKFFAMAIPLVSYIYRISFGTILLASMMITAVAMTAVISSTSSSGGDTHRRKRKGGRDEDDDNKRTRQTHSPQVTFHINLFDLWYILQRPKFIPGHPKRTKFGFLEAVFSFLFGDGDPNEQFNSSLSQRAAKYIQDNDGWATAEELALFCRDLPELPSQLRTDPPSYTSALVSEAYVLPFLINFRGIPRLIDDNIVYHFPDLVWQRQSEEPKMENPPSKPLLLEVVPEFSRADSGQITLACMLGVANYIGVSWIGEALRSIGSTGSVTRTGLWSFLRMSYPFLRLYSIAFLVTPAIRYILYRRDLKGIHHRNALRHQWLSALQHPNRYLIDKIRAKIALKSAHTTDSHISDSAIVFDSQNSKALRSESDSPPGL